MGNAVLYTRVSQDSTGEQLAVTRQFQDCEELATRLGYSIIEHFSDNDLSAFSGKRRPRFEAMLTRIGAGGIDAIICWQPDRLYRSMKDLERIIDIADAGIRIESVNGGAVDLTNSTGRMLARIVGSVARQESELKAERRRRANLQRAEAGQWRKDQTRTFGYTKVGELIPREADAIRQAIHDVLAGKSLRAIAMEWNDAGLTTTGGKKWTNLLVRRTLMRPQHAGIRIHQGKPVGTITHSVIETPDHEVIRIPWQAIIDETTHRGLVAYLNDPARAPGSTFERRWQGSGTYRCGICDNPMGVTDAGKGVRYTCKPTKHVGRLAEPVDQVVDTLVIARLTEIADRLEDRPGADITGLHAQRDALTARMDELARLFAAGVIDASQLQSGTVDLRSRRDGIDRELADAIATSPAVVLLDEPDRIAEQWHDLSPDLRSKVITELMTVTILPTPKGVKGVHAVDGKRILDPQFISVEWK